MVTTQRRHSPGEGLGQHWVKAHAQLEGGGGGAQESDGQSEEHPREVNAGDGTKPSVSYLDCLACD